MEKKVYEISVYGCDDSSIFKMELSQKEAEVVKRVAERCKEASEYSCMPTMNIKVA